MNEQVNAKRRLGRVGGGGGGGWRCGDGAWREKNTKGRAVNAHNLQRRSPSDKDL